MGGRPGKSPGIHRDGPHAGRLRRHASRRRSPSPAAALLQRLLPSRDGLDDLDGAFAAAWWDGERACSRSSAIRSASARSTTPSTRGVFYFASELKQLLAIPGLPVELDPVAIHKYLTFSFVPGEDVPVRGVKRLLPGRVARLGDRQAHDHAVLHASRSDRPALADREAAVQLDPRRCAARPSRSRLNGEHEVGAVSLRRARFVRRSRSGSSKPASTSAPSASTSAATASRRIRRKTVAEQLGIPLDLRQGRRRRPRADPHRSRLEARPAVRRSGHRAAVPARRAARERAYGGLQRRGRRSTLRRLDEQADDRRRALRRPLRRGQPRGDLPELVPPLLRPRGQLYTPEFRAQVGPPGPAPRAPAAVPRRRAGRDVPQPHAPRRHLAQGLAEHPAARPSEWPMPGASTCACRSSTARWPRRRSRLPPQMKLHGACEKYVLKLALQKHLPREIVWRRKFGMSVPITDWALGPLAGAMRRPARPSVARAARAVPRRIRRAPAAGRNEPERDPPAARRRAAVDARDARGVAARLHRRPRANGREARDEVHPLRPRQQVQGPRRTGRCPKCQGKFAFEPQDGDPVTDCAFQNAIEARVGRRHGALGRRASLLRGLPPQARRELVARIVASSSLVLIVSDWSRSVVAGPKAASSAFCRDLLVVGVRAVGRSEPMRGARRPVDLAAVQPPVGALARGPRHADGLIVRRKPAAGAAPRPRSRHRRLLVRPRGDLRSRARPSTCCSRTTSTSRTTAPCSRSTAIRRAVRDRARRCSSAIRDCRCSCCTTRPSRAASSRTGSPRDRSGSAAAVRVIDVGLRPRACRGRFTASGCRAPPERSRTRRRHLAPRSASGSPRYALELAAIRPEQVIKRLFRAMNRDGSDSGDGDDGGACVTWACRRRSVRRPTAAAERRRRRCFG